MTAAPPSADSRLPRAVVFDLDGTLIDSAGDIADVLNYVLAGAGLATLSDAAVRRMIGSGARVLIERAMAAQPHPTAADLEPLLEAFEARYLEIGAGRSALFPGGAGALTALADAGCRLGICTNKPQPVTDIILDELALRRRFGSVVGVTALRPRKPAPDMLLKALADLATEPADAIMVGDSETDLATARAAGVPIVLVSFGYTNTPAIDLGADAVIDHLGTLPDVLARLASRHHSAR